MNVRRWFLLSSAFLMAGLFEHPSAVRAAECVVVPDTCCEAAPRFRDQAYASILGHPIAVVTFWNDSTGSTGTPYVLRIMDLLNPPTDCPAPSNPNQNNWNDPKYSAPGWTTDSLGLVYGLTLDRYGNIYVTHTSCFNFGPDNVGFGGAGAIYRIDAVTGYVTVFAVLPNAHDPGITAPDGFPGLGNITYDCDHNQFFVTDEENGKIYRLQSFNPNNASPASVLSSFDHGVADNGLPGFAPLGERLWAVQWHGNRIYYGIWGQDGFTSNAIPNEIWSVALGAGGAFITSSDQKEITLPPMTGYTFSNPPSDISFAADGRMLIGERGMYGPTNSFPHRARTLEYSCQAGAGGNLWMPTANIFDIGILSPSQPSSAGGVDYDRRPCLVWSTGDYLSNQYYVYGIQGMATSGGNPSTSLLIDFNGAADYNKTQVGDVEVPCADTSHGEIHGQKFKDSNRNGVNNSEPALAGWTIRLTDVSNATQTTTTDALGNYAFLNLPPGPYTVDEILKPSWVEFAPNAAPYGKHLVSLAANQVVTGRDFGNDSCAVTDSSCAHPPLNMVAWWPFDEPANNPTAKDVVHLSSGINLGTVLSGSNIQVAGKVGNYLHDVTNGVEVPTHATLNFFSGNGDFSIDCWVRPVSSGTGFLRSIVDKRSPPNPAIKGYRLYLNGQNVEFEMGNGATAGTFAPGITLTANVWAHVTVTVKRGVAGGMKFYVNGLPAGGTFTAIGGSVANTAKLYIGMQNPAIGSSVPFEGCIDELELFNQVISPTDIAAIAHAGSEGKCKEICYVPTMVTFGLNQNTVTTAFTLCNYNTYPMSFVWSLAGLPAGPGCNVPGPTTFSPPAGTVINLLPGSCTSVPVTITRPAGLTGTLTACYQLTVFDRKGHCFVCKGTVRADSSKWTDGWGANPGITVVHPSQPGTPGPSVAFWIKNWCPIPIDYSYQLVAVMHDGDQSGNALRLNGLPPGEPVIGTLTLAPSDSGLISVGLAFDSYQPFEAYDVVLQHDLDNDGVLDDVAADGALSGDDQLPLGVEPTPQFETSLALSASPNPFRQSTGFQLALGTAQSVRVAVYDVSGRLVREIASGRFAAGHHPFLWDGRDAQDRPVGVGIYFIRARLDDRTLSTTVVRLR